MTRHLVRLGASAALALVPFLLGLPALAAPALDDVPTPSSSPPTALTATPPASTPAPRTGEPSLTETVSKAATTALTPTEEPPTAEPTKDAPMDPTLTATPSPLAATMTSSAVDGTATPAPTDPAPPTPSPTSEPPVTPEASVTGLEEVVLTEPVTPTQLPEDGSPEIVPTLPTDTPTPPETDTPTPTPTSTPSLSPELFAAPLASRSLGPGAVLINEVAWAGTDASPNDEWIELWNPGPEPIDLTDWTLTDGGDIRILLSGEIAAFGFYLLERTDEATISDLPADRIYTGSLHNAGEALGLYDPSGNLIDTANASGGPWPAGGTSPRASMERHGLLDLPGSWATFPGPGGNGLDAAGNPIRGTPRLPNAPRSPATATPTPTEDPAVSFPPGALLINEVAWAGTIASGSDEWIELHNPGDASIDLDGWRLTDDGDIDISLDGVLDAGGYYLLERTDDTTIANLAADRVYTGGLSNSGEALILLDPIGTLIDAVNTGGGPWPAGDASRHASMERAGSWRTFTGYFGRGFDAAGNPICGTPGGPNSILFPTPMPTWIPGRVVINELLIRPRYDWEGTGGVTTGDEFIELYNRGPGSVNLRGWTLDDVVVGGSAPYELPGITIEPGAYVVFFRSRTRIALNDSGDSIRLAAPDGTLVDKVRYLRVRAANLSFGRLPDGDENLAYGLWPTPGEPNERFTPRAFPPGTILINEVAWAGSLVAANHEWIELWNPGSQSVNLFGWTLTDDGDIEVHLSGVLEARGYALLERSSDQAAPAVPADVIYTGSLANDGERLRLLDPSGAEVDVVNPEAGSWPAGDLSSYASMERAGKVWKTYTGHPDEGILGSPRAPNRATPDGAQSVDVACPGGGPPGPCP